MSITEFSNHRAYLIKYHYPTVTGWTAVVVAPSIALAIQTLEETKTGAIVTSCSEIEANFILAFEGYAFEG